MKVLTSKRGYGKRASKEGYNPFADFGLTLPEINNEHKNSMDVKVMLRIRPLLPNESKLTCLRCISNSVLLLLCVDY
jgi:hypothetical protein